ncbi:hypothetical protein BH10PSE19_BH10PSE19_13770 [soil metagenome]
MLTTNYLTNETLRTIANTDANSLKTTIHRLIEKGVLTREKGKRGKGGFLKFSITEEVRNLVINELNQLGISKQLDNELGNNKVSNKITNAPSSSSNINTTTTLEPAIFEKISVAFEETSIDIEPLTQVNFTKQHLDQILKYSGLDAEIIQESINAFAFDLEYNNKEKKLKTAPLNYFMGILRKGIPYAPPSNYESPQELAMRVYVENKRKQQEKWQSMEREAYNFALDEWLEQLSDDDKEKILTELGARFTGETPRLAMLRDHFAKKIWPIKVKELGFIRSH